MRAMAVTILLALALAAAPALSPAAAETGGRASSGALTRAEVRAVLDGVGFRITYVRIDVPTKGAVIAGIAKRRGHRLGFIVNSGTRRPLRRLQEHVPGKGGFVASVGIGHDGGPNDLFTYYRFTRSNAGMSTRLDSALCKARVGEPCGV